jgi:hypothetical protein
MMNFPPINKEYVGKYSFFSFFFLTYLQEKIAQKNYGRFMMCFRLEFRPFGNLLEAIIQADFRIFYLAFFVHQV